MAQKLPELTLEAVREGHAGVVSDSKYGDYEQRADKLYDKYGDNADIDLVALKVAFIDATNSTNLRMRGEFSYIDWAEGIVNLGDFDQRVQTYDPLLVLQIAEIEPSRRAVSFASKYVTYHNRHAHGRDDYSIFDSILRRELPGYLAAYGIERTQRELEDYERYHAAIGELIDAAGLGELEQPRRDLDHFIWWTHRGDRRPRQALPGVADLA